VLSREGEVGQQHRAILEHLLDRLGVLGAVGRREVLDRQLGSVFVLGVHDRVQGCLDLWLQAGRHRVEHVGDLV
jgi:hypothetical protein